MNIYHNDHCIGFETYHIHQLRNFLFDTNPRLAARLLSRTGSFFASEPDSLRWIPVRREIPCGNLLAFMGILPLFVIFIDL